jgi:hypothetical protein
VVLLAFIWCPYSVSRGERHPNRNGWRAPFRPAPKHKGLAACFSRIIC